MTALSDPSIGRQTATSGRLLRYLPVTALVIDVCLMSTSVALGVLGRQWLVWVSGPTDISDEVTIAGPLIVFGWVVTSYLLGAYRDEVFGAGSDEYKRVLGAGIVSAGLVGIGCYLTRLPLARGFFFLLFAVGIPVVGLGRFLLRRAVHRARRSGLLRQRILIVGSPSHIDEIAHVLGREEWLGYDVVGALTPASTLTARTEAGVPVVGNAEEVTANALAWGVDAIFFAGGALSSGNQMRNIVWELEGHSISIILAPSVTDISSERIRLRPVGGLPLMHLDPPTWSNASRVGKRAFDLAVCCVLVTVLAPAFLVIAIRVKVHDGGPVLFRQLRTGRRGREFSCFKFRSMIVDAEAGLAALHDEHGYVDGLFKLEGDPRITGPGRFLRRYSLDELPQLFNVIRGDMSLVGPRPPLPLEVERYDGDSARRLHVRPGMTGLWQVSGRSDLSWEDAIRLDLYYVDNWSMLQDVSILLKTVGALLSSRGAY